jgi:peptidyl-prolyl cis-trans isomerase D
LQDQKAENLFLELERKLSDALFDAPDIRALAEAVGVEVKTVSGFTREGGGPLGDDFGVINAIFDEAVLSGEQMSEIIEIDASRSAVFAVTQHRPATRQALDDVRDAVESTLKIQKAEELMAARAEEMLTALEAGADFAEAAAAIGATAEEPVLMSRNMQDADQFISVAVFTAVKPSQDMPTAGSTRNGVGGYTVYSIESVIPGRPEVVPVEQRDQGKLQLTDQIGVGEYVAFMQELRENAEIIINEDALAAPDLL